MKDFLKHFGKYLLAAVIALLSFLGGSVTDVGQAVQIAFDKDKALTQAAVLLDETPKPEIVKAVAREGESPAVVEDIKPTEPPVIDAK